MNLSPLRSRILAAFTAGALLSSGFAATTSAGGFEIDIDRFDRFTPIDLGHKPCDDENVKKYVCSPDFTTHVSTSISFPGTDGGVPATFFLVTVRNDSRINSNGSELVTAIGLDQSRILKVEPFAGVTGWTSEYQNEEDGNSILLRHPNGLKAGQFSTVAVWYAGYDFTEFGAVTNVVESSLSDLGRIRFDQLESDTTNNESSGDLDWTPRWSKG